MASDVQPEQDLAGRRVLVVGASAGIGRAVAETAAAAGACVAIAARRFDVLREVVAAAPVWARDRLVPVQVDVRVEVSVGLMGSSVVQLLGGLDTVVYSTGVTHLAPLAQTTADDWRRVLDTNLVGAALVTRVALPALNAAAADSGNRSRIAYLSSHAVGAAWPGLGAYVASKAALNEMVTVWAAEHTDVSFTRIIVGPTLTGMADAWSPELAEQYFARWAEEGRFDAHVPQPPQLVAAHVVEWMRSEARPGVLDLTRLSRQT